MIIKANQLSIYQLILRTFLKKNLIWINIKFINRVFTRNEINKSKKLKNKINYYAIRFAAKEAFVKAIGEGFRNNINFRDIDVTNDNKG